jgi:hypothetical protein
MVNRKTILKQLEHINLSGWAHFKQIDTMFPILEKEMISKKERPQTKIGTGTILTIYQLWGVPSEKLSLDKVFEIVVGAGREYTCTPGVAPGSNCPQDVNWMYTMPSLMLIVSLQEDHVELARLSNWFKVEKHSYGEPSQIAHQPILYNVADMFRKKKFTSYEKLNKFLTLCRVKEPPLLMSALEGIRVMDSNKTFDNLITAARDHARRTNIGIPQHSVLSLSNIVALYPSLLWNVAELRGLQPPSIPPEIRPFMLTRQTLGLPPIQVVKTAEESKPVVPKTIKAKLAKGKAVNGKTAKAKTATAKSVKAKSAKTSKAPKTANAKTSKAKTAKTAKAKKRKAEG